MSIAERFLLLASYEPDSLDQFFQKGSRAVSQQYGFQNEIRGSYGHTATWLK
jgi:hypothetical protein